MAGILKGRDDLAIMQWREGIEGLDCWGGGFGGALKGSRALALPRLADRLILGSVLIRDTT
jgi:hypothetical protein